MNIGPCNNDSNSTISILYYYWSIFRIKCIDHLTAFSPIDHHIFYVCTLFFSVSQQLMAVVWLSLCTGFGSTIQLFIAITFQTFHFTSGENHPTSSCCLCWSLSKNVTFPSKAHLTIWHYSRAFDVRLIKIWSRSQSERSSIRTVELLSSEHATAEVDHGNWGAVVKGGKCVGVCFNVCICLCLAVCLRVCGPVLNPH